MGAVALEEKAGKRTAQQALGFLRDNAAARYACLVYASAFLVILPCNGHVFTARSFVKGLSNVPVVAFYCRRLRTHTLGSPRRCVGSRKVEAYAR